MAFIFASSCFLLESHAFQWRAAAWLSPSASQGALCCHSQAARTGRRGTGEVGGWEGGQEQRTRWTPRGSWLFPSSSHLFHFRLFFFSCDALFLSPLFNHVTDKAGPENNWAQAQNWRGTAGLSEAATEVTWHNGCAWTEKTRSLKDRAVPF